LIYLLIGRQFYRIKILSGSLIEPSSLRATQFHQVNGDWSSDLICSQLSDI